MAFLESLNFRNILDHGLWLVLTCLTKEMAIWHEILSSFKKLKKSTDCYLETNHKIFLCILLKKGKFLNRNDFCPCFEFIATKLKFDVRSYDWLEEVKFSVSRRGFYHQNFLYTEDISLKFAKYVKDIWSSTKLKFVAAWMSHCFWIFNKKFS